MHAWDLAGATGQDYGADPAAVVAATVSPLLRAVPGGAADDGGLFGPPVAVPETPPLWTGSSGPPVATPAGRPDVLFRTISGPSPLG